MGRESEECRLIPEPVGEIGGRCYFPLSRGFGCGKYLVRLYGEAISLAPNPMSHDSPRPHDITPENLEFAMSAAGRPDLLYKLVELSRQAFGFFTTSFHHTNNYPWAAAHLEHLTEGSRALEIGAGLNPLPLFLAQRGIFVDCVDGSSIIRTPPPAGDWNEWGFFDYSALHSKLMSYHCDIAKFTPEFAYDVIYSICVIAHMPRATREDTIRRCRRWLKPGGTLLLAIDLIPVSDFLWNRGGGPVEPPSKHGTMHDVMSQLSELGFAIVEQTVFRNVPRHDRTELLFIACKLPVDSV
jgi:2-polyprenyl-3-methyl-5-hydroxy-6-metoxy-1,4-benzoquinol methylase